MYLTREEADRFLDRITALSAPGSRLASEYFGREWRESDAATADEHETAAWSLLRTSFQYGPVDDTPAVWLAGHGWTPGWATTVVELGVRQGREYLPPTLARPDAPQILLFDGTRTISA